MKSYLKIIEESAQASTRLLMEMYNDTTSKNIIVDIAIAMINSLTQGKKILVVGNGGSAADAQHLVAELVSKYQIDRKPLRAIAPTTDTSVITSIGNDYGYEHVFKRQVEALGEKGDFFIGITTSGKSANVIAAMEEAKRRGMITSCLCGEGGIVCSSACDIILSVPSSSVPRIQEMHGLVIHQICEIVESSI